MGKNKISSRNKISQKLNLKMIMLLTVGGFAIIFVITIIINLSQGNNTKANVIDIREVEVQNFTNEMSVPSPLINNQKKAGPNTIYIKRINL